MISHTGIGDLSTSLALAHHEIGHVARIGSKPREEFAKPTFAAGALLWREKKGELQVAVVHRPHYDDWSLPKGKVDAGENLATTAVREIQEETGLEPQLGWLLGYVQYPVKERTKVVYYWTAEVTEGTFKENNEVDELRWLSPKNAQATVSYDLDREVIAEGTGLLQQGCDRRVILIRHAKAHDRQGWAGDDNLRPLAKKGRRQAEMLVSELQGYGLTTLYSAEPVRCQHTAEPLAQDLGLDIKVDERFGDHAYDQDPTIGAQAVLELAKKAGPRSVTAIISQGTAIPGILEALLKPANVEIDDLRVKKSSAWVLHLAEDKLLGADYLASPFPVK